MNRMMTLLFFAWASTAHAGGFQDAQNFASQHNTPSNMTVNGNTVPGYTTANPPQTNLNSPSALSNASTSAIANDATGAGTFIQNSAVSRPQFNITANDPLIQGAKSIQSQAGQLSGLNPTNTNGCQSVTTTNPAVYDTYTCTKSNTIINPTCNTSLSVTAKTTSSCTFGTQLNTVSLTGIAGPATYGTWTGTMSLTANCGAANGYSDIVVALSNAGGNCDNFKTYRNLGHLNLQITPQTTIGTETLLGDIYMVKWSSYFYCINPAKVYYTFQGCNQKNLCTLDFRVDDGRAPALSCSNGTKVLSFGGTPSHPKKTYSCFCSNFARKKGTCPTIVKTYTYLYKTLTWTQNHGITTFVDSWNKLPCQ